MLHICNPSQQYQDHRSYPTDNAISVEFGSARFVPLALRKSPGTTSQILLAVPLHQLNCTSLARRVSLSVHAPGAFSPLHSSLALSGNLHVHALVRPRLLSAGSAINRDTPAFGS